MTDRSENIYSQRNKALEILFAVLLLLLPLLKINQGVDLTDTPYSLGNYRFFEGADGVWVLATFLSNVTGYLFTRLPFGGTMIGMKLYSSLLISFMALFSFRFFKTKMPMWVAFLGEVAAIGFCWCPSVILYNYMTYLFFLICGVLLFRGLAGNRPICLFLSGISLGLNVSVRVPNILEAALILCVWYYGARKKKSFEQIAKETGFCIGGFLAAQAVMFLIISLLYGFGAYGEMIGGLFGMSESASDYTFSEMLLSILSAYGRGIRWMVYPALCILPGIPFLILWKDKGQTLQKIIYCACIVFLFFVLYKWGMFNFRYYQKESGLQWGVVFLLISLGVTVWMLFTRMIDDEWMLIGSIALIMILITPLGSNNYVWPALNNLFFVAPVTFWMVYRFVRWGRSAVDSTGRVPFFPAKAMLAALVLMFVVQSIGLLFGYVFLDGEDGTRRTAKVENSPVLAGMYTSQANAESLESLFAYLRSHEELDGKELILYGNIPGLSYYLDRPCAIRTSWPDLDTSSYEDLKLDLNALSTKIALTDIDKPTPLVILAADAQEGDKLSAIRDFMEEYSYQLAFQNERFLVYW